MHVLLAGFALDRLSMARFALPFRLVWRLRGLGRPRKPESSHESSIRDQPVWQAADGRRESGRLEPDKEGKVVSDG